jgi:hypothetical protein
MLIFREKAPILRMHGGYWPGPTGTSDHLLGEGYLEWTKHYTIEYAFG